MRWFYDIGIRFYYLAAWIASAWNRKARLWIRGRKGWHEDLRHAIGETDAVIWFHCASLGEFEQGRPVMEACRKRYPSHKLLLTFFSPSGYEKQKTYAGADHVMYLPLDTRRNARKMIESMRLEKVMFVKYEFWYHYLERLKRSKVPVYLLSGIFRPGQLFFRWYGGWYRNFLRRFTHLFVQHEDSKALLETFGITHVSVAGDTRFDRVTEVASTAYRNPSLESFCSGKRVLIAGSTWEKDEQLLGHAMESLPEEIRWIIAPHELSEGHIKRLMKQFPCPVRFTRIDGGIPADTRVVIVDCIGKLSLLYRYGTVAYIGGGFGKGIHNTLEAAAYGLPVIFGPVHTKYTEAKDLVRFGGAFTIQDGPGLVSVIEQQLANPVMLQKASEIACSYVKKRVGATSAIMNKVSDPPDSQ